jgi:AcrR family transcriptional regulator
MFVRDGYEATTMRAIAERVEYTPTALYHHFLNKEALLAELCADDFRTLARAFQSIGRVEDPIVRLERIGEAYVDFALQHPMHYRFMFMTPRPWVEPEEQGIARGDPGEDAYAFLVETCSEAIARGVFREEYTDAHELAQILWACVHGLVSIRIAKEHDPYIEFRDVRTTARRIRQTLMRGLLRSVPS